MESSLLSHPHSSYRLSAHNLGERICKSHTYQNVWLSDSYMRHAKSKSLFISCKDSANHYQSDIVQPRLKFPGQNNNFLARAASLPPLESELGAQDLYDTWNSIWSVTRIFYRSIRPYAIIGTAVSVTTSSLLAVEKLSEFNAMFLMGLMQAVVAAVLMNIYMVFINNLTDIDIDKVNKPYLAIASGEFSYATGIVITIAVCAMSFFVGLIVGSRPLLWALFICFVLGTGYSVNLPLLRWKKSAITSQMTWISYQTVLLVAYFLHIQTHVFGKPDHIPNSVKFAAAILSLFSVAIASFKDIPDTDGDRKFGVDSFAIRIGQKRVFWLCILLLELACASAILIGLMSPFPWSKFIVVFGHAIIASVLWGKAKAVDLKSKVAITSFYMFVWKLFYVEHLLIPFLR